MQTEKEQFDSDDLDVFTLIKRVVFRWKIFVLFGLGSGAAIFALNAIYAVNTKKVAQLDIRTFGIEQTYPNGTPFSLTDFLEPAILNDLFASTGLTQFDPEEYENILSIRRSTADTSFINAKYAVQADLIVADKDQSESSLAALQDLALQKQAELQQANKDIITLQVDYERFGIDKQSAEILLETWPKIWANYMVRNYRVVFDLSLNSMALIDGGDLSVPENAYYARQQLDFVRGNVQRFTSDPRYRRMVSNRGRTPIEILRGINEYDQVLFTPLYSSILSIESPLSEFYLADKTLRIEQLDKQIASLQTVVDDITKMEMGVRSQSGSSGANVDGDIIQIGDGTLNDIVGLVQKASLQDFLTSTLERRHQLVVEKTGVEKGLSQIKGNTLLSPEFVKTVSKIHKDIIDEYGDLLKKAEVIAFNTTPVMYQPISDAQYIGSRIHPKAHLWPLVSVFGLIVLAFIFVVIPTRKEQEDGDRWP